MIYIRTEMFFWDSLCGMYIPTEMIFSDYHVGCTYLQKWFSRITVWDVHTYGNDWVSMLRPIAHGPNLGPRRAYPRRFLGRVGRTPYRTHSLGDGSKCHREKGLKIVCLVPTHISGTTLVRNLLWLTYEVR